MRDSVPSVRYSSVCNVLRQWSISIIPTGTVLQPLGEFMTFVVKYTSIKLIPISGWVLVYSIATEVVNSPKGYNTVL